VLSFHLSVKGSHAIRAFSPITVTVPFGLLRPAHAAGVSHQGQPAGDWRNDLENGIAFIVIRPYLGWHFDDDSIRSQRRAAFVSAALLRAYERHPREAHN
jgi:hypothetical protein